MVENTRLQAKEVIVVVLLNRGRAEAALCRISRGRKTGSFEKFKILDSGFRLNDDNDNSYALSNLQAG